MESRHGLELLMAVCVDGFEHQQGTEGPSSSPRQNKKSIATAGGGGLVARHGGG